MDKGLKETKEKLTRELVQYAQVKDISNANLDTIYKTVKTIYYLTTMEAMDEYSKDYSHESGRRMNTSMDSYMSGYSRGYSEARMGRDGDSDGRYNESASYGYYGYSGHDAKEHMIREMQKMMQELEPREQQAVQECISRIK